MGKGVDVNNLKNFARNMFVGDPNKDIEDRIKFAEQVLGTQLFDYQKEMLRKIGSDLPTVKKGRELVATLQRTPEGDAMINSMHNLMSEAINKAVVSKEKERLNHFTTTASSQVFTEEMLKDLVMKLEEEQRKTEEGICEAIRKHLGDQILPNAEIKRHKMLPEDTIFILKEGLNYGISQLVVHNIVLR